MVECISSRPAITSIAVCLTLHSDLSVLGVYRAVVELMHDTAEVFEFVDAEAFAVELCMLVISVFIMLLSDLFHL